MQIVVWRFLLRSQGSDVLATKKALLFIVLLQYVPRFARILPLTSELKRTAGVFAETAWAGAVYYLLLYMLASHVSLHMLIHNSFFDYLHLKCWVFTFYMTLQQLIAISNEKHLYFPPWLQIVGAFWYLLSVERNDYCWQKACKKNVTCDTNFLYCGNQYMKDFNSWSNISESVLNASCGVKDDNPPFDFGIFKQALSSGIVFSMTFFSKYCYCLWWGLQNLRWRHFAETEVLSFLFEILLFMLTFFTLLYNIVTN